MNSRLVIAITCAAFAAAGVSALAQAPQQPTFRAGVEIVEIQAVVTDAQGNPVSGLTEADFEILENGKPQSIAAFSIVDIPIERADRPLYSPAAIEPDVLSNQGQDGRVYMIAFDEMTPLYALRTRIFLRRFIERHLGANDTVAIGYFGVGARNSQEFTGSKRVLLEALDRFTGGIPGEAAVVPPPTNPDADPADAGTTAATGQLPSGLSDTTADIEARFKLRNRMKAFRDIVEFLAAVPGQRKALLYMSTGIGNALASVIDYNGGVMPIELEDAHAAMRAAATGNIAIYPINPAGLEAGGGAEFTSSEETNAAATPAATRLAEISNARMLAEATGGFAFQNQNSFDQAFERLVRENSSYYAIGYNSTNERRDGRFRRLQVRVKRPGLQVRARNGYLAPLGRPPAPDAAPVRTSPISAATADALRSARPVRGVPMKLFAAPFKGPGTEASVALSISVDPGALDLVEKDGVFAGKLEITTAATGARKTPPGEYHVASLALRRESLERARTAGVLVIGEMRLAPGRYQIRAAAGNGSARAGSVIYDLDVPDFSTGPLTMSGVAVVSAELANVPTVVAKNPLRDFLPAPPTTAREFAATDRLVLFAEIYDNLRTAAAHTVELTATLRTDDGREIRRVSEERSSSELTGGSGGFGFRADLPLEGAAPGLYVIHIDARANVGDRPVVSRDVTIRIK